MHQLIISTRRIKMFLKSFLFTVSLLIKDSQSCMTARKEPEYRVTDVKINRKDEKTLTEIVLKTFPLIDPSNKKDISVPLSFHSSDGFGSNYIGSIPGDYGSSVIVGRIDRHDSFSVLIINEKSGDQWFDIINKCVYETTDINRSNLQSFRKELMNLIKSNKHTCNPYINMTRYLPEDRTITLNLPHFI